MDAGPEIHPHHHHHKPMRHWIDMAMGASAIVLSIVSLFVALEDGNAMKRLVQSNSWPFVAAEYSTLQLDGTTHFKLTLINKGVGPAKIETLEVFFHGKPVPGPRQLVAAMIGPEGLDRAAHPIATSDIVGSVLSARESIDYLDAHPGDFTPEQNLAMRDGANSISTRVCYCSVFDECWVRGGPDSSRPIQVDRCKKPKAPYKNGASGLDPADLF